MERDSSFKKNLSWIFAGNLLHAVFSFLLNILVARILSTGEFGELNYAAAWIALYNSIAMLGVNGVINKYTIDDVNISNTFLSTAVISRIIASVIGVGATVLTVYLVNTSEPSLLWITFIQSLSILFAVGDTLVYWFLFKREANLIAILKMIAFVLSALIRLIAVIIYKNVYLYCFGLVVEAGFFSLLLIFLYRKKYIKKIVFSTQVCRTLLKNSYPFIVSMVLITVYAQTDRIMLKFYINNEAVAFYSIAYTVAGLASVFVSAIIEGFRPEIFRYKSKDEALYLKRLKQTYFLTFWLSMLYCVFISIFPKQILLILYDNKYIDSSTALAIVVWYSSFSYLGVINNIYMVAENKQRWSYIAAFAGAISNVLINIILIPNFGITGAAIASFISQLIANYIILLIIPDLRPLAKIVLVGVFDFKNASIFQAFKDVVNKRIR